MKYFQQKLMVGLMLLGIVFSAFFAVTRSDCGSDCNLYRLKAKMVVLQKERARLAAEIADIERSLKCLEGVTLYPQTTKAMQTDLREKKERLAVIEDELKEWDQLTGSHTLSEPASPTEQAKPCSPAAQAAPESPDKEKSSESDNFSERLAELERDQLFRDKKVADNEREIEKLKARKTSPRRISGAVALVCIEEVGKGRYVTREGVKFIPDSQSCPHMYVMDGRPYCYGDSLERMGPGTDIRLVNLSLKCKPNQELKWVYSVKLSHDQ